MRAHLAGRARALPRPAFRTAAVEYTYDVAKARETDGHHGPDMTTTVDTVRWAIDPDAAAAMGTDELRAQFPHRDLFEPGRISLTYTHYDRMIVGGAMPARAHR